MLVEIASDRKLKSWPFQVVFFASTCCLLPEVLFFCLLTGSPTGKPRLHSTLLRLPHSKVLLCRELLWVTLLSFLVFNLSIVDLQCYKYCNIRYIAVIQLYIFFRFFSVIGYHTILNIVPGVTVNSCCFSILCIVVCLWGPFFPLYFL